MSRRAVCCCPSCWAEQGEDVGATASGPGDEVAPGPVHRGGECQRKGKGAQLNFRNVGDVGITVR